MFTGPPNYFCRRRRPCSATVAILRLAKRGKILGLIALLHATPAMAAGFEEGRRAFESGNHATALQMFRAEADRGHAGARYYLGRMHLLGEGVSADYKQAAAYFLAAAASGNADAQYFLGALYYLGEGVSKDYASALLWYRRAAAQGDSNAQYSLGVMYAAGEGVPKDTGKAMMWFMLAAQSGLPSAVKFKDLLVQSMTPDEIDQARRLAREWYRTPVKPLSPDDRSAASP